MPYNSMAINCLEPVDKLVRLFVEHNSLKTVFILMGVMLVSACQTAPQLDYIVLQPAPEFQAPPPRKEGEPEVAADAPPEPAILAFSDREYFMLDQDMYWTVGKTNVAIRVPAGFVSDGASVPKVLWPFGLTPYGTHGRAAVVHDYLYWSQVCSRKQADNIMLIAMKESGVNRLTQFILSAGVKLFGGPAWNENKRDRQKNIPRLIEYDTYMGPRFEHPESMPSGPRRFPIDFSWKEYEGYLVDNGAEDPAFPIDPPVYCKYGDSAEIPQADDI